jgi:hypothetical protein
VIGEAEIIFNQYILKSENVPMAKDIIRLRYLSWSFLEENRGARFFWYNVDP